MKTGIAIIFLAMFMATNCASVTSQRRLGMTAGQKNTLKAVLKAGIDLSRVCAIAELESKFPTILVKLGVTPAVVVDAIANLANKAVDQLIGRRRRLNIFTDAASAVSNAAKTVAKGASALVAPMNAAKNKLNKLTGGLLAKGIADIGCPALVLAIKAGIIAQFPGVVLPACVTTWFTSKCKSAVASAFKRARILRRLSALRRSLINF